MAEDSGAFSTGLSVFQLSFEESQGPSSARNLSLDHASGTSIYVHKVLDIMQSSKTL